MTESSTTANVAMKEVLFGSLSGMAGKMIEYPFDTIKVRLQSQSSKHVQYKSTLDCIKHTLQVDGVKGLYRGLSAPMVGAMFENAILFVSFSKASDLVRYARGIPSMSELDIKGIMSAGALSGIVTSFVLTPIELVKCQLQVQTTARPALAISTMASASNMTSHINVKTPSVNQPVQGISNLVLEFYRTNGMAGFWRGQITTMIRESGGSCCWFSIYELSLRAVRPRGFTKKDNSQSDMMISGALAGVGYNTMFFPADTVKSRMQTNASQSGMLSTISDVWRHHGFRGFFKGWGITVIRAAPSNALIFWVYETLMRKYA